MERNIAFQRSLKIMTEITHDATRIVLKRAVVDKKMQPIIKWLNSFDGVFTRWCCEGMCTIEEDYPKPYVLFYCDGQEDLNEILRSLRDYGKVEVEFYQNRMIRYCLRFRSLAVMEDFIKNRSL